MRINACIVFCLLSISLISQEYNRYGELTCEAIMGKVNFDTLPETTICLSWIPAKRKISTNELSKFKSLKTLKLIADEITLENLTCKGLGMLDIESKKLSGIELANLDSLKILRLYAGRGSLDHLLPDTWINLEQLAIGDNITINEKSKFFNYINLRSLWFFSEKTIELPEQIIKLSKLNTLGLYFNLNRRSIELLKQMPDLEVLKINYKKTDDYGLLKELKALKLVKLYGKMTDFEWEEMKKKFPKLQLERYNR